jgi:dTDP-4-amino-4,6-dideoxygalactose transaminase
VVTNEEAIAQKMHMLRDHGQSKKYYHDVEGYNGRLDSIQAGILSRKLRLLAEWNEKRRAIADRYNKLLATIPGVITPFAPDSSRAVYHLYVIRAEDRAGLQKHLSEAAIDTGIHYPIPLHLQKAYSSYGYSTGDFPVTERIAAEILSLPMYPQLTCTQQDRVVDQISRFYSSRQPKPPVVQMPAATAL